MGSRRLRGNTLSLLIEGVDYWADATSVVMDSATVEIPSFCGPPKTSTLGSWLDVEAVQSTAPGSLWRLLWDNQGRHVPFAYIPHGNAIATPEQPHFTGILALPDSRPALGGAAGAKTFTFTVRLYIAQGPLRVTTP